MSGNSTPSIDSIIAEKASISNTIPNVLAFKKFYLADYQEFTNPQLRTMSNQDMVFSVIKGLLKRNECTLAYSGEVDNIYFDKARATILFFETDVVISLSFEDSLVYAILNPKIDETGLESMDGLEASIQITSMVTAIKKDSKPEELVSLLYKDANLILSELLAIKHDNS